ncbi:MAG: ABC transporter substrate-binding protein [Ilumatobacteraceae bacterium]
MITRRRILLAALALVPLAAACGGGQKSDVQNVTDELAGARPTTSSSAVPLPLGKPSRIVSLSPSATEILFAVGAGPQVIAVDSLSNYPPEAPITDLSAYEPNVEAIAKYQPDLVVTDGTNAELNRQLNQLGIPVFVGKAPKNLDQLYQQIEAIGAATGNIAAAGALSLKMQDQVAAIIKTYTKPSNGRVRYYLELDQTFFSASSKTFIGTVMARIGVYNIADKVDDTKSAGYPQLTPEFIIAENPDVIFLADTKCCGQNASTVAARPGWSEIRAVKEGRVVALDDDIAQRWGPRVIDLLQTIVAAIQDIKPDPTAVYES